MQKDINLAYFIVAKGTIVDRKIAIDKSNYLDISITDQITKKTIVSKIPTFTINGEQIYLSTNMVDKIKENTLAESTIFQIIPEGMLRISTTVSKEDGSRAVGTFIPTDSPVYKSIIKGEEYFGTAQVLDQIFAVGYKPLRDMDNNIVGAVFVGRPLRELEALASETINGAVVGKTGYFFILDSKGNYVLSLDRKRDGENIWQAKDADGKFFIQDIVNTGVKLKNGETATSLYAWKNTGETTARDKIATYMYYPDSDWIIAASVYYDDFTHALQAIKNTTIIVTLISIIIGTIIAYIFAIMMTRTFQDIVALMSKTAEGDLTQKMTYNSENEIGQLASSLDKMTTNLKLLISNIKTNTNTAAATAEELSASSEQVNASTQQVSSTVQEIAKGAQSLSISAGQTKQKSEELISSIKSVAQSAQESAKNASEVNSIAKQGEESGVVAKKKMVSIQDSVLQSSNVVKELGQKSQQINKVIEVINSISEQTNLLALNAAIEAARAGEAGRGFAVVADEVRKLAEESQKATKQIEVMIDEIAQSTKQAVESMNKGSTEVEEGSRVVNDALASLGTIGQKIEGLTQQIETISAATQEQLASSDKVLKSISEVSAVAEESSAASEEVSASVQETTASMQQVATAAQELAKDADELKHLIEQFKIDDASGGEFEIVKWSEKYSIKVEEMDKQHQRLFYLINQLHAASASGKGKEGISQAINGLVEYTKEHFSKEEDYMQKFKYDGLEEQKKQHAMFIQKVTDFQKDFNSGKVGLSNDIIKFLVDWLINHISKTDRKYANSFHKGGLK